MMDTGNYVPKHVIGTCNCVMFKASLENIIGFLSIGKMLIIQCPSPHNELHCSDSLKMPCVAISHVWVDGLGNTIEDELPTCQIKWLLALTNQLTPSGTF